MLSGFEIKSVDVALHRRVAIITAHASGQSIVIGCVSSSLQVASQSVSRKRSSAAATRREGRRPPRPKFTASDKLFWVVVSWIRSNWKQSLILVSPDTVVRRHRAGFRPYWCASPKSHPRRKWRDSFSPQREQGACTRPKIVFRSAKVLLDGNLRARAAHLHNDGRKVGSD